MKKEEKNKVGRPKLADKELKKRSYIMLVVALLFTVSLIFGGLFSLTNVRLGNLKGEAKRIKAITSIESVSSNAVIIGWASDNAEISSFTIYKGNEKIVSKYPATHKSKGTWEIINLSPNTTYLYSAKFKKFGYSDRIINKSFKTMKGAGANTVPTCSLKVVEIGERSVKFAFDAGTYYKNSKIQSNIETDYTIYEGNGNGKKAYHEGSKLGKAKTILVKGKLDAGNKYMLSVKFDKECKIGNDTSRVHNVYFNTRAALSLSKNVETRYTYKKGSTGMYFELETNRNVTWGIKSAPSGAGAYYKVGNKLVTRGSQVGERSNVAVAFDKPGTYVVQARDKYGSTKTVTLKVIKREILLKSNAKEKIAPRYTWYV